MKNNNIVLDSKKSVFAVIMVTNHIDKLNCIFHNDDFAIYHADNCPIRIIDDRENFEVIFDDFQNEIHVHYTWNNITDLFVWQYERMNELEEELNNYKISLKHEEENIKYYLTEIDELTKENKYKSEVIEDQEKTIFTLDETINFYRKFNIELNEKIEKIANEKNIELTNKIEELNNKIADLYLELTEKQDFICSLQKHLYSDRKQMKQYETDLNGKNDLIQSYEKQLGYLQRKNHELRKKIKESSND